MLTTMMVMGRCGLGGMHGAVIIQRSHPSHPLVDVIAVKSHKQHNHRRNGGPNDLEGKVALNGSSVAAVAFAPAEAHKAEDQQTHDPEKKDRADAEQNLEQGVVNRRVGAGVDRQHRDVVTHPKPGKHKGHAQEEGDQGGRDRHGAAADSDRFLTSL